MVLLPLRERRRTSGALSRTLTGDYRGVLGVLLTLSTLSALYACKPSDRQIISREQYISLYVEILRTSAEAADTTAAYEQARQILAARGLTHEDLNKFAMRHADDPAFLAEVWQEIEDRLRAPVPADTTRQRQRPSSPE